MEFNQWHELEHNQKYQKKQEDVMGMVQLDISWSESKVDRSSAPGSSAMMPLAREKTAGIPTALAYVSQDTAYVLGQRGPAARRPRKNLERLGVCWSKCKV